MNISPSFRFARGPAGVEQRMLMTSLAAVIWGDDSGIVENGLEGYRRHAKRGRWLRSDGGSTEALSL